jgi:hypothetical protein
MTGQSNSEGFSDRSIQRWRMIQVISLLPLIVSIVLMFYFKGSMLGTVVFFLVLIVGIMLPQISRNIIESHLILKKEIDKLQTKPSE